MIKIFNNIKSYILSIFLFFLIVLFNFSICCENKKNDICNEHIPSLSKIIDKAMPSIVSIDAEGSKYFHKKKNKKVNNYNFNNIYNYNINEKFEKKYFSSLGSGVIIDSKNGYVVTNSHVIKDTYNIEVKLNDGRIFNSEVVGMDNNSDIALIKLKKAKNLVAIKFFDSDKVKVGDYSIAIGNPYGLGNTVTYGIVSAVGRNGLNIENYENFIQTDASINKGSSGGALINLKGELIGLNTAILSPKEGNIGIGFSIPSNMVKNLTEQIEKYGKVQKRELGIIGIEIDEEISKSMHLKVNKGIFISKVIPYSVAEKVGINIGDIIISINNKLVKNFFSFKSDIYSFPIDKKIELKLIRNGKTKIFFIEKKDFKLFNVNSKNIYRKIPGLLISMIKINGNNIIKVKYVKLNSYAYKAGFRNNDVILNINNIHVNNFSKLDNFVSKKKMISSFYIKRGNNNIYLFMQS
ncbi:trypsin-like peptidase domain-containing protein [Buchnera aphidicola (Ceratovacuna keduensis)]|uniref:trypsin-like peptidase domain-containing protein n=1 Tax=Buchnera aphidicola TaxID=9 RepID=UPI0031B81DB2